MSSATAAMITIQGTSVKFASVQDVVQYADMKNRRALNSWWRPYKDLAEELGGLPQLQHS
jgi:6-phosphofructokinase 1